LYINQKMKIIRRLLTGNVAFAILNSMFFYPALPILSCNVKNL
jgi:hypothetical protein